MLDRAPQPIDQLYRLIQGLRFGPGIIFIAHDPKIAEANNTTGRAQGTSGSGRVGLLEAPPACGLPEETWTPGVPYDGLP